MYPEVTSTSPINNLLKCRRIIASKINYNSSDIIRVDARDIIKEEFKKINDYNKTLDRCHNTVGIAILNTSITIVFGFSILILSKFIPTIYFGIFTGLAMLLAMISVLTLLPSLILLIKPFGK